MLEDLHRIISNLEVDLRTVVASEPSKIGTDERAGETSPMLHHVLGAHNCSLEAAIGRLASLQDRLVL